MEQSEDMKFDLAKELLAVTEKLRGIGQKLMTRPEAEMSQNFYRVKIKLIRRASETGNELLFLLHS